jgi:hypothetical protein
VYVIEFNRQARDKANEARKRRGGACLSWPVLSPSPPDTQPYTVADIPGVTGRVIRLKVPH